MDTFRILAPEQSRSFGRYTTASVDTSAASGTPIATVRTETGIINPLGMFPGSPVAARVPTGSSERAVTGTGALAGAIDGLHAIGTQHRVTGINLGSEPRFSTFRVEGSSLYINGGTANGLTDAQEAAVHAAAGAVLDLLEIPRS